MSEPGERTRGAFLRSLGLGESRHPWAESSPRDRQAWAAAEAAGGAPTPSEKPLPDAPGWWIVQEDGEASEPRLVEMRLDEEVGIIDAEGLSPSQWDSSDRLAFGPLALPWEAT